MKDYDLHDPYGPTTRFHKSSVVPQTGDRKQPANPNDITKTAKEIGFGEGDCGETDTTNKYDNSPESNS